MTTRQVTGQVSPDRVSTLEAEVAQLKATLSETRRDVVNLEGLVRDLGLIAIQAQENHMSAVLELGRLTDHVVRHTEEFRSGPAAFFCAFCTPIHETHGGPDV